MAKAAEKHLVNVASDDLLTIVINVPKMVRKSFEVAMSKEEREAGNFATAILELDMSKATAEAILDSAIRTVVINTQSKIRGQLKKTKASIKTIHGTVWKGSIRPSTSVTLPPLDRARMAASGLTNAEKLKLFEQLEAELMTQTELETIDPE